MTTDGDQDHQNRYGKDFLTGCLAIILISVVIFIIMPFLIFIIRLSLAFVIPVILLLLVIIFTIFFGHIINIIKEKRDRSK